MMSFGLCGAHRSGKTTLAKLVAEGIGVPYVNSSVREALLASGVDPVAPMSPAQRILVQEMYLSLYEQRVLANTPRPFITDRTPIDIAAYLLGEMGMHSEDHSERIEALLARCFRLTREHFSHLIVVPPLPFYAIEPGKPPMNKGYQWHIHALVTGLAAQVPDVSLTLLRTHDLEQRIGAIEEVIQARLKEMAEIRRQLRVH
jgi:hypothetical protein